MDRRQHTLCKLHTLKAVQIGCCITCDSSSTICETKACIKHHISSQKMHTIYTLPDIQQLTDKYHAANEQKRSILRKLVNEYFHLLKVQIETLYHEVQQALKKLRFENYLMNNKERELAQMLVEKRYSELTCSEIAMIIPKMKKCSSFEQKQFNHLRDFLHAQKENLPKNIRGVVLNLPYFRLDQNIVSVQKFTEVSHELLSHVNDKLEALTVRPRKLRIKYSDDQDIEIEKERFIKLLENSSSLKQVEVLEFFCTWNIREEDFQIDFIDAVLALPYLSAFTIFTGYRVTSTAYIEDMAQNKNIELKIYKKKWDF